MADEFKYPPSSATPTSSSFFDVVILSALGRGQWLAYALKSQGLEVALVDFFGLTQNWKPEDIEGPFGLFQEDISSSEVDFLMAGDALESVPKGFVFWLPSGPLELRGPLYFHRARTLGLHERVKKDLQFQKTFSKEERKAWQESCLEGRFQSLWPIYMAHQISASHLLPKPCFACSGAEPLSLFSPFFVRYATANGYQRTLDYLSHKGISVYTCKHAPNFSFTRKNPPQLAFIETEKGERIKSPLFISTLSGEESYFVHPHLGKTLWPQGFAKREWSWVRYRLGIEEGPQNTVLPQHFALLQDVQTPWTHANFALVQRTFFPRIFNLWLRLSSARCFDVIYLKRQVEKVLHFWQKNLLHLKMEVLNYPVEIEYGKDPSSLGPRPFNLFSVPSLLSKMNKTKTVKLTSSFYHKASVFHGRMASASSGFTLRTDRRSNVLLHTPECYSRLDINARLQGEEELLGYLLRNPDFFRDHPAREKPLFLEKKHENRKSQTGEAGENREAGGEAGGEAGENRGKPVREREVLP